MQVAVEVEVDAAEEWVVVLRVVDVVVIEVDDALLVVLDDECVDEDVDVDLMLEVVVVEPPELEPPVIVPLAKKTPRPLVPT